MTYTVSDKLLKARKAQAERDFGRHNKVDGMARCAGPCRQLKPYVEFGERKRPRGIQQGWCVDCRAAWKEHGLRVTNTANDLRIDS